MNTALAEALLVLAATYLGIGLVFALAFVGVGVARIDRGAASGTLGFRVLILPGTVALWPLLARRWLAARHEPPEQRDAHTDRARGHSSARVTRALHGRGDAA